jgi:nitroreductase
MDFFTLIRKNRSYRRFYEDQPMPPAYLRELVDYARLSASSGNVQGLKFFISDKPDMNQVIFSTLKWAFYLKDWEGPETGERPAAYIIILGDSEIHKTIEVDVGIAAQSIMLGAVNLGFGGCMIGSIDRVALRRKLSIPDRYEIPLVIALGKPRETVVIEPVKEDGSIEYWRDDYKTHHVPKRDLNELIIESF